MIHSIIAYRIISRAVQLNVKNSLDKIYGIMSNPMDLGTTPQRVGILHTVAVAVIH